ncbi:MAG: choice-of-anchor L domain-containing protein, partial [Pseudomonadota bacterium]
MTRLKRLLRFSVAALTAAASLGVAVGQATVEDESASGNALISRLQGTGLVLSNPSLTAGAPTQFGLFTSGASAGLSIDEGIAINTGSVLDQFGPNNADSSSIAGGGVFSDPDLTAIDGAAVNDVAILEFDITLDDPATGFAFNYQFGSEEYPDFVGSGFNDLVAFFVTGPGLPAAQNFALSPNGSRVRINNINAGVVGCSADGTTTDLTQSSAYINNGHVTALPGTCQTGAALPGPSPIITEYNGVTQLLTARATGLIAGQTYRMKIAIADVGDNQYDSGIFMDLVTAVFQPDFGDAPNTGGFGDPSHAIDSALRLGTSISGEDAGSNT